MGKNPEEAGQRRLYQRKNKWSNSNTSYGAALIGEQPAIPSIEHNLTTKETSVSEIGNQ